MDIIRFLKLKLNKNCESHIVDKSDKFKEKFPIQDDVCFESTEITNISSHDFIDATDSLNIAKYKNNLKLLIEKAKKEGKISNYVIIRNDDNLPDDWIWQVTSKYTSLDLVDIDNNFSKGMYLSYQIRVALAEEKINDMHLDKKDYEKLLNEEIGKIDKDVGRIYKPSHFRSTKHFTINTPLASTLEYNWVDSDRNFHIIDSIDNFLNSGYGYSASYRDAYLDVTHEGLPISPEAVILISEEKYNHLFSNIEIMNQLKERRVVIYRGDSSLAINMFLTEIGILPSRPENLYQVYDEEILTILESSMQQLCLNNNLIYNLPHGGIEGHFTSLLDQYYNIEEDKQRVNFLQFLKIYLSKNDINVIDSTFRNVDEFHQFVEKYGISKLLQGIDLYNSLMKEECHKLFNIYKLDREGITPEISLIFKTTLKVIIEYSKTHYICNDSDELFPFIKVFYFSNNIQEQLTSAVMICQRLNVSIEQLNINDYKSKSN